MPASPKERKSLVRQFARGAPAAWMVLAAAAAVALSCRRADIRTATIDVPRMAGDRDIRIVTNAALDEVVGRYDGTKHDFEVDLQRGIVLYHEGERLLAAGYQRRVEARIREVGFEARVLRAGFNPPPPVPTVDGPCQTWPNRFTAVIAVPAMKRNTDANIVTDAIAYARLGRDDPRVAVIADARRVVAVYESLCLSLRDIEHAIACAGFAANDTPANLGAPDSVPLGWTPVNL